MAVSLLISSGNNLIEVADACNKIDKIKLRAGFPFGDFELPTFKYTILKSKLDLFAFLNRDDFITTVSGRGFGKAEFNSVVENKNVKGEDFYTIKCTLRIQKLDFNNYHEKDDDIISYINFYHLLLVHTRIWLPTLEYIDFYESPFTYFGYGVQNDTRSREGTTRDKLYLKRKGSYNTNFELIKTAFTSFRWFFSNMAPQVANYDNNGVMLSDFNISLIDPYLWDIGNPYNLDESLIIKESEEISLAGFKITRDIIDRDNVKLRPFNETKDALGFPDYFNNKKDVLEYEPEGSGKKYSINLTSPPEDIYVKHTDNKYYNLLSENGGFLEAGRIAAYYRRAIMNRKLIIETLEKTNIVPYRSVARGNRKYYCIDAQIDIKNDGINKYILQERFI